MNHQLKDPSFFFCLSGLGIMAPNAFSASETLDAWNLGEIGP